VAVNRDVSSVPVEIEYPVLLFGRDTLTPAVTPRELKTCTRKTLEKGYFRGVYFIDSSLHRFDVKSAYFVRNDSWYRGWPFYDSRLLWIDFEFTGIKKMSIEEVRNEVRAAISHQESSFSAAYADASELARILRNAESVSAIAEAIR